MKMRTWVAMMSWPAVKEMTNFMVDTATMFIVSTVVMGMTILTIILPAASSSMRAATPESSISRVLFNHHQVISLPLPRKPQFLYLLRQPAPLREQEGRPKPAAITQSPMRRQETSLPFRHTTMVDQGL